MQGEATAWVWKSGGRGVWPLFSFGVGVAQGGHFGAGGGCWVLVCDPSASRTRHDGGEILFLAVVGREEFREGVDKNNLINSVPYFD